MIDQLPPPGPDRDVALGSLLGLGGVEAHPAPGAGVHLGRRESPPRWSTDRTASNRLAELMAARGFLLDARIGPGDVACYAFFDGSELAAGAVSHGRYVTGSDRADAVSAAAMVALGAPRRAQRRDAPERVTPRTRDAPEATPGGGLDQAAKSA